MNTKILSLRLQYCVLLLAVSFWGKQILGQEELLFRTPYSLQELIHDRLTSLEVNLESVGHDVINTAQHLSENIETLRDIISDYDSMIDKSNIHTIYKTDREYLQNMIDRIDQMIQTLESSRTLTLEQQILVSEHTGLLDEIRQRVSC